MAVRSSTSDSETRTEIAGRRGARAASLVVPVGFVDSLAGSGLAMPLLGDTSTLVQTVERDQVTTIIIASGAMSEQELGEALRLCGSLPVEVYVIPRFVELGVTPDNPAVEDVWGVPLIWLRRPARRRTTRLTK